MKKLTIAGSRTFSDYTYLEKSVDEFIEKHFPNEDITIISGCARGADRLDEEYAKSRGYDIDSHPAQWDVYGKCAGFRRNEEMVEIADGAVLFWDGHSHGTKHDIELCTRKEIPFEVKYF